uniref:(northern house mosquito) hypothetical protein n=1 Tax=Culex pipiens TaxID=7175 RepID=A0A8D8J5J7_CULPI
MLHAHLQNQHLREAAGAGHDRIWSGDHGPGNIRQPGRLKSGSAEEVRSHSPQNYASAGGFNTRQIQRSVERKDCCSETGRTGCSKGSGSSSRHREGPAKDRGTDNRQTGG